MNTSQQITANEPQGSFEEIEAAVRETERGRWFLDEYRRRLQPETRELLGSLRRIERAMHATPGSPIAAITAISDKLRSLRRVIPIMAEVSARASMETARVAESLRNLALLEDNDLIKPDNRFAMRAETERLKALVQELRAIAENLGRANGALAAMDHDLNATSPQQPAPNPQAPRAIPAPQQAVQTLGQNLQKAAQQPAASLPVDSFHFGAPEAKPTTEVEGETEAQAEMNAETKPEVTAEAEVKAEAENKADAEVNTEVETPNTSEQVAASEVQMNIAPETQASPETEAAPEKPRIIVSHGAAMPPMPEDDDPEIENQDAKTS